MVLEPGPACVMCCNGPSCKWLSVGACRFSHHGTEAATVWQAGDGGESGLDAQVRELREAFGEADWMEANLKPFFERICEERGAFEMPKI